MSSTEFQRTIQKISPMEQKKTVPVISDFSYTFTKGQKIGIFGDNGSGKSTFLNIVTGRLQPDGGTVVIGENTFFGYYMQNPEFKDLSLPVLDYIKEVAENVTKNDGKTLTAGQFLNEFGFEGKILHSPLSSLSGGERKRLFLIRLLMTNPNFLILDEPTNDFDIFTMNVLEQFLMQYQGCLLVVSHDRYFMDKVADTLFILEEDGNISGFVGKCSEYLELREKQKKEQKLEQKQEQKKEVKTEAKESSDAAVSGGEGTNACSAAPRKRTYREQKEFESLEAEILELEDQKSALEAQMSAGEKVDYENLSKAYNTLTSSLEEKYGRWEELASLS